MKDMKKYAFNFLMLNFDINLLISVLKCSLKFCGAAKINPVDFALSKVETFKRHCHKSF
jgi:hypothetical protein